MKRLFSLFLALTMLVSMFTIAASANELGTIAFFNAADNTAVTQLDGVDSICANVTFTAQDTGSASIMVAHYDIQTGALLKMESIDSVSNVAGVAVEYTTDAISVADTDLLKVFAWDTQTLAPLTNAGVIERDLLEELPTASVAAIDSDADFALNFVANDVTDEQLAYYGDWKADFVFVTNKDATFNADGTKDGYLIGQYDAFGPEFVKFPVTDLTVTAGTPVSVLETAGMSITYRDVVEIVKDFDCGVNFADAYLAANDGLEVSLALVIVNPVTGEAYSIAEKSFNWTLPTATVTHLDTNALGLDAEFAMNFTANEATESQLATFGDWAADYVVTLSKDATFNADGTKDGYLLGQYDQFGAEWVKLPVTDLAITAGVPVKVLETAGMSITYRDVVEIIKDFDCGINFSKDFLAANDGVSATVEIRIYNPLNPNESYGIGDAITRTWKQPTATVTELDVEAIKDVDLTFALNFKADAVTEEQLAMFGGWYSDYELTINKTATFNANGNADGFLSGQYDAWSKNWISVPFEDATLQANTPVKVMETAAALMGKSGLKLTYADIVNSVKDFNCGLAFTPEFLVENPDLEVTLALKMYNPNNEDESYIVGRVYTFTPETIPSIDKFVGKDLILHHTIETIDGGKVTATLADLFNAVGPAIKDVVVSVDGATVNYADNWADTAIDFITPGTYTVEITDNYYCNAATATVTVVAPEAVDKFVGKDIEVTHTLDTIESGKYTVDFADLFDTNGYAVKDITVTGATYADGKVTVEGLGTFTVTATDNFYCNVATATITVKEPANVDKFTGKTVTYTHTLDTIEGNTVTFDFADLFENNGYEVKDITVTGATYADGKITVEGLGTITVTATDNFYCNVATATITVNDAANVDKFTGKAVTLTHTLDTIEGGKVTAGLTDLFEAIGPVIMSQDVVVTVEGATVNKVASDWTQTTVDFTAVGEYAVTITDNFYCNIATATVTVVAPEAVDKFVGKDIEVTHTLDTIESGKYTVDFSDLFDTNDYEIKEITVTGATYADGKVTVEGLGKITVTATDNFYCNEATATITVKEPAAVTKWTATNKAIDLTVNTVGQAQTVNFADVFKAVDGAIIKTAEVTVENGTYANGVIIVPGKAGTYTVTVTDNFYCNPVTATITVNDAANVDKFTGKTVSKKLAYGSNTTTVTLGELFTAGSYTIKDVTVTGGTYAKGTTWDKGTVTVTGTGTFTITITDNYYCNTAKATLTVAAADLINKFTAKNPAVTHTLASIDAKAVSVKLGDIFSGTNVVTGNITVTIAGKATTVSAADWANATVTIPGTTGDVTVTINDNNTCITATGKVTLKAPANVDKWTTSNKTINLTLDSYGTTQSINFADMFTAKSGAYIKTVSVTVNNGGSYASNKITVPGKAGTYTVTVTDNFYCNAATATITVKDPTKVIKWTAKTGLAYEIDAGASKTLKLSDIFTLNNNYKVGTVTYAVEEQGTKTVSGTVWANTQITFPGAGTYTVTITDDLFSDATYEATVKVTEKVVEPVRKFKAKDNYFVFQHTVENPGSSDAITVKLGDIFAATGEGTINSANVTVAVESTERDAKATISKNSSDWTQSTITITDCGEVTLTITDNQNCVVSKAIIGTTPKWVGDIDDQDHYNSNAKQKNIINNGNYLTVSTTKTFTVSVPNEGVYGIQWYNVGAAGTTGKALFTVNGYSVASTVPGGNKWSDDTGVKTDFALYLVAGTNTITVQNIGTDSFTIYPQFNTMRLNKSGYNEYDFMPLVKDWTESGTSPDDEQGGGTVTPPEQEWPVPEIEWNGKFSGHQYFGDYYGNSIVSPKVNATYSVGKYTVHTITIPNSGYEGVYVLQFKTTSEAAKIRATTADGYYADFNLTEDGWSSSCAQDQLIYLKKGANTVYVQNVGDDSFVLTDIDIGYFDPGYEMYYMYNVKTGGTLPN